MRRDIDTRARFATGGTVPRSSDKNLVPELYYSQLVIPPMMTNKLPYPKLSNC